MRTAPAYSGPAFDGRAISSIIIDPNNANTIYVGSVRAARGISSVLSGGVVTLAPGLPPYGFWKSTDGGANFTLLNYQDVCINPDLPGDAGIIQASFGSTRGVHAVALDPGSASIVYAAPFPSNNVCPNNVNGGVWRSTDSGASWTQMKNALNATQNTDRASFAVTPITGGFTRMYVGDGNAGTNAARLYRTDDAVHATNASFTDLTALQQASSAPNQTIGYCTGQCWYDNVVYSPPGKPKVVYLGGSYDYGNFGFQEQRPCIHPLDRCWRHLYRYDVGRDHESNTAGKLCSAEIQSRRMVSTQTRMQSWRFLAITLLSLAVMVVSCAQGEIFQYIITMQQSRGLSGAILQPACSCSRQFQRSFLQLTMTDFQHCNFRASRLPLKRKQLKGGTQDNGTFEKTELDDELAADNLRRRWSVGLQRGNSALRFNSFTSNFHDVNFRNGDPVKWVIASGPIVASGEGAQFYSPIIPDPVSAGTIFQGSLSVWRTQDWAGNQAFLEANCPEFTTSGANPACGDFVAIGPAGATRLTVAAADYRGTTLAGGNVAAVARASSDTATLWAATTTGRVFISKNADTVAAGSVTYTRLDSLAANSPAGSSAGSSSIRQIRTTLGFRIRVTVH